MPILKTSIMLLLVLAAGPALAVPPLPNREGQKVAQAYISAVRRNDLLAYAQLFADDAQIVVADGLPVRKSQWMDAAKDDFVTQRYTRFLRS